MRDSLDDLASDAGLPAPPATPADAAGALTQAHHPVFEDEGLRSTISRAVAYLDAGVPVHLRGPAGVGKTTLARAIAARRDRPVAFLTGDRWMTRADLVGREVGERQRQVRDRYIQRVSRTEIESRVLWRDSVLTEAMERGQTLIYDDFNRATAAANATMLSVLEDRAMVVPDPARSQRHVTARPGFSVILTSNPEDYDGVMAAPDALLDRVVTFDLSELPEATERGIVALRAALTEAEVAPVVRLVRALRDRPGSAYPPSVRTAILIARLMRAQGVQMGDGDGRFVQICLDVLSARTRPGASAEDRAAHLESLKSALSTLSRPNSEMADA